MEVRLSVEPWLNMMLAIMTQMAVMGYWITEEDIDRLVKSAVVVEVE